MPPVVSGLALTPVKGTRLQTVDSVALEPHGVRLNRRFFLIDDHDRMINGKHLGELNTVVAAYSEPERRLRLQLPGGQVLEAEVRLGDEVQTKFYSRSAGARLVEGPWSSALSELVGRPVRLVEADEQGAVDRGARGAVSLISSGSLRRLAEQVGCDDVDPRRFRMLIEVDGLDAHAEDAWVGCAVRVGDQARVRFEGHVGRCLITSRDPVTGVIDLPTLDILGEYRRDLDTTEPLPFGIYGRVLEPGTVGIGDAVAPEG
jgi:uncharacterized protein YcbX